MKITRGLSVAMNSIFVVVFNAVFFILSGTNHPASVWISYGFIHFAYFMLLATRFWVTEGRSAAVFNLSLYSISFTYFLAEFILGLAFVFASPESYKAALSAQLSAAGVFGIVMIANIIANQRTAETEHKHQIELGYVKRAAAEVAAIMNGMSNRDGRKNVERVYDAISASPAKSHPDLFPLEAKLLVAIADLRRAVESNDMGSIAARSDALLTMVGDRNRKLKLCH